MNKQIFPTFLNSFWIILIFPSKKFWAKWGSLSEKHENKVLQLNYQVSLIIYNCLSSPTVFLLLGQDEKIGKYKTGKSYNFKYAFL